MREFIDISDVISSPHRSAYESFLQLDRFHGKIPFDPETGFYRLARESLHFSRTFPPQPFRGKEIPTYPAAKSAAGREPLCRHCIEYVLDMLLPDSGEGSAVVFSDLFHPATKDRLAASGERLSADAIERIREHNLECLDRKRGKPFGRIKVLITADDSESEGAGEIIRQIADSGEEFDAKKFERHVRGGMECVGYSVRFPWERSGERTEPDGYARRLEDYEAKCRRHGRSLRVAVYVDLEVRVDKALVYENHRWEKSSFPQRFRCYIGAFPLFTSRSTFLFATVRGNVERVPVLQLLPRERLEESEGETQIDRHCLTAMRVRTFADHLESVVKRALKTGSKWVEGDFAKDGENFKPDLMKVAVALESGLSRLISGRVCRVFNSLNPLSEISQKREITLRGPGGVSGQRATFDHRAVHWSHSGRICLTETPESEDIGLNLYLALAAKVDGDRLLAPHTELRENGVKGNTRWLGAEEESRPDCVVAPKDPFVRGRRDRVLARTMGSRVAWLEPGLVSHTEKYHGQMLGIGANLIPFVQHDDNNRVMMGAKNMKQALPLKSLEEPIIQTGREELAARLSGRCLYAEIGGTVEDVTEREIVLRTEDGDQIACGLAPPHPTSHRTVTYHRPCVRAGREVTEGMLLADGAATCNGKLALGVNVLAAYMPYKGLNFEDGIVISDRLVRDDILTSLHMVRERFEVCEGEHVRCPDGWYSGDEKDEIVELYERAGVYCRAGEEVRRGDPLFGKVCFRNGEKAVIYALAPVDGRIVSVLHREIDQTAGVEAGGGDGVVEDYRPRVRFFKECRILTERRAEVGDKLMGRHGNKGVIARIVPEAEMPHMKDGTPVDVVLNPHGVVSRMNLGQILETHWSWVVRKGCGRYDRYSTVAPFEVFPEEDLRAALESLSETGVSADGKFELLDGRNGKPFKTRIVAGYQYFMKLNHLVEDKLHARETGPCSMMVKQPVKGKKRGGGQRLGEMEVWALQSHSCPFLLREMLTVKSDLAEFHKGSLAAEQWNRAFPLDGSATMTGSFHAALMLLRGFGLETVFRDEAGRRHTLEDLKKGGEASRVRSVRLRFAGPEEIEAWADGGALTTDKMPSSSRDGGWDYPAGGLFDPALFNPRTGKPELDRDLKREKMGFIPLAAPVIHPLLIDDIAARVSRKLQGSKERKEIIRAVRFEAFRDGSGRFHSFRDLGYRCACGGLSGGILSGEGCFLCRSDNAGSQDPGDPRLDAGASLLLRLAEETGLDLSGNVLMTRIPVLPLDFRPLRATQGDNLLQSDLNTFYRDILTVNRRLGDLEENSAARPENPRDRLMRLILARRLQIGVVRLMVGTRFTRQKNMKSISDLIKGKEGIFRMHLLGKRANVSGRSVIVPGPELRPHEVGIPRQMLEGLIGTKLQSHLVTQIEADERKDRLQAVGALKARGLWHYFASIDNLLRRVPFVLNRSPSLHKYSVLAFRPVPVREKAIVLNPLACRAFNADFDGDTMSVFVPLFEESRREAAENMAATRNVLSVANGRLLYHFDQDIVLGIYLLTSSEKGRAEFNGWFEEADLEPQAGPVDKGKLEEHVLQYHLALRDNARTAGLAQRIMVRGFAEATEWGTNFGIFDVPGKNDLGSPGGLLDEGVLERELKAWIGKHGLIPGDAKPEEVVRTTNPLALLAHSGAKGGTKQLMQLGIMRGQLQDVRGEKLGPVVSGNFRDGISPIEYYIGSHSGRRTMCEKKLSVAKAGDLTRTLVEASYPLRIRTDDCGSREGILLFPFPDIPLEGGKRRLPSLGSRLIGRTRLDGTADSPGDRKLLQAIEASGRAVRVRSALTCRAHEKHGYGAVCRACYGWDLSRMDFPGIGDPVGIWASQSLGERGTQLSMRTFHTGGAGGEGAIIGGLTFIQRLFVCSQVQLLLYSVVDPGDYPWSRGTRLDAWTLLSSWEEGKIFPTVEPAPEEEGDGAQRPLPRSLQEQFDLVGGDLSKLQAVAAFECCRTYDNAVDERHIEVILKAMLLRDSRELTSIKRAPFAHPGFLAQAAYQQAMRVLVEAALSGTEDHLQHPKARIMLGMPIDTTE